jgi:hypothetical protein
MLEPNSIQQNHSPVEREWRDAKSAELTRELTDRRIQWKARAPERASPVPAGVAAEVKHEILEGTRP